MASANGAVDAIRQLVVLDTSLVLLQNMWDETSLHLAAHTGHTRTVQVVLEVLEKHGQNGDQGKEGNLWEMAWKQEDKWGRNVMDIAKQHGQKDLVVFLKTVSENPDSVSSTYQMKVSTPAVSGGGGGGGTHGAPLSKKMEFPLDQDTFLAQLKRAEPHEINGKDMYKYTAVHKLSSWSLHNLAEEVVRHPHFDPATLSSGPDGNTPLHLAVESGSVPVAECLLQLKEGRDSMHKKNTAQMTPAGMVSHMGHPELLKLFSSHAGCTESEFAEKHTPPPPAAAAAPAPAPAPKKKVGKLDASKLGLNLFAGGSSSSS